MGNGSEFQRAVQLIIKNVSFNKSNTVQVFEATIRYVHYSAQLCRLVKMIHFVSIVLSNDIVYPNHCSLFIQIIYLNDDLKNTNCSCTSGSHCDFLHVRNLNLAMLHSVMLHNLGP